MHLKQLLKFINKCYIEKTILCLEHPKFYIYSIPEILYDMLILRYGLRTVSKQKFNQIIKGSIYHSNTNLRVKVFLQFIGIDGEFTTED
jgi:hypothetical protein|mmetsp:Transcript_14506/g.2377  ORF Transcript_14506/g.2377 Transcript_14506/m.2377 type:complete len:89 (+) Transcript_14506:412-678(+)